MIDLTQVLPDWDFVGGSTQSRTFQFANPSGDEYNMQSGVAYFSICEYVNDGAPVLSKTVSIAVSESGNYCMATVSISSADTKDLSGCYRYQVTVKDGGGNVAIPFHGMMHIAKNIAPDVLA